MGNAQIAGHFVGANSVLAIGYQPHWHEPLIKANRRIFEDGAYLYAELLSASFGPAFPAVLILQEKQIVALTLWANGLTLEVAQKQKPRGRLWLNDGSCVRLRPERRNHVWSYDFVSARTHDGLSVRLLNLIDEHTRKSLLVRSERRWSTARVISALTDVLVTKGVPEHLRSDNGPEFVAKELRRWLAKTGAKTLYIEPGSPWENGYCESFNSKLRDEFLNGEVFYSMKELRVLVETLAHPLQHVFASSLDTASASAASSILRERTTARSQLFVLRLRRS